MKIKHDIVPSNITNRLSFNFIFANLRLELTVRTPMHILDNQRRLQLYCKIQTITNDDKVIDFFCIADAFCRTFFDALIRKHTLITSAVCRYRSTHHK